MLTRLRPRRFASYSAASARANQRALLSPVCQAATPIDSVIRSILQGATQCGMPELRSRDGRVCGGHLLSTFVRCSGIADQMGEDEADPDLEEIIRQSRMAAAAVKAGPTLPARMRVRGRDLNAT